MGFGHAFQPFGPLGGGSPQPPSPFPGVTGSLRRFTRMQFSQLTGIVATRIDRALSDLVTRYNGLQPDDLNRRMVARQFVGGFSPLFGTEGQDPTPFMDIFNGSSAQNPLRLKGTFNECATDYIQYAWTNAIYFPRPVRVVGVYVNMMSLPSLGTYENPWSYGNPAPDPRAYNDWLNDMYVDLSVDSKWYKGNSRKLNESEVQKAHFTAQNQLFSPLALADPIADNMLPEYPSDTSWKANFGVAIDIRNINVALPEQSTVRLSILFPDYGGVEGGPYGDAVNSGWNNAGGGPAKMPWANQTWSYTLTVLESLT